MTNKQELYERCFLLELEDLFFYSRVKGNGRKRLMAKDVSSFSQDEADHARQECRDWIDKKMLGRFNKGIFTEPVEISISLNKEVDANYFEVEGETYKLIMCLNTENGLKVFLRSLIKAGYDDDD